MIWRITALVSLSTCGLWALDVKTFGAMGNGISDDTVALQNAVNSCPSQGTVTFSPGNYLVSGLTLKPQCTYAGTNRTTITLSTPNRFIFDISERSDIHITGLVLNANGFGGGVLAQGFAPVQNIQIDNCEFRNVPGTAAFPSNLAIVSTWGIVNATIQNNRFSNVAGGIWVTTVENTGILNNSFQDVTQGDAVYVAPNPSSFPSGDNLVISGNTGANMARIAIEIFRPDPSNGSVLTAPIIENNVFSNWTNPGAMGLSITHGDGAIIRGNRINNRTGPMQDSGLEVIVANAQVTDNVITGNFGLGIAIVGTAAPTITGNVINGVNDTGIILACDGARNRCASRNAVISGNSVVNARHIGIKLDNDWSNSLISRNTITRTAGLWAQDNATEFSGIHQSPAPGPSVLDSNVVVQDAAAWPNGFGFCGIRLNSSMPGSTVSNNVVRSNSSVPFGSGLLDNTGSAKQGWKISGNSYLNLWN